MQCIMVAHEESSRVSNYLNVFLRTSSLLVILSFLKFVTATREGNIIALSGRRIWRNVKKTVGEFTKPLNERNKLELKTIRKYYRWLREGKNISIEASGKTIYVDGKKLMRERWYW